MTTLKRIAIFRTGTYTSTDGRELNATPEYLRSVVAGYNPTAHESPAVIGHPKDNHPAYGWVQSLSFNEADGVLYADFADVDPQFATMLQNKRFKKRSSSFYPPNHPSNPTQGKPYLRHVGFLGAQPPAVKGLPDFSDDADCPTFEFAELSKDTNEPEPNEDDPMSDKNQKPTQPAAAPTQDFAEQQANLEAKEKALEAKEAAIAKREADHAQQLQDIKAQNFGEYADSMIKTGQIAPAEKDAIVSVMLDLDSSDNTFDFAENGTATKKSSVDVVKDLLARLPATVDFSERTATDPNAAITPNHDFNPDHDAEMDKEIQDFAEANGITYAEAAVRFGS